MPFDYSGFSFPKGAPRALERHRKGVAKDAALESCYADVDKRDGKRCQVTGVSLTAGAVDEKRRLERNHLKPRSTAPESRADADNVLTVSAFVHALMQASALIAVDAKGRKTMRVSKIAGFQWNRRMVPAGKEPFRLKPFTRAA